jgi:hypothetical protein
MDIMRAVVQLALGLAVTAGAAAAATQEQIGSWVLSCPGAQSGADGCIMRSSKRLLDKGGITGDLEVLAEGRSLVPVITLRGLSREMLMAASLAGKPVVSLLFAGAPREALTCSVGPAGYICSPQADAARNLAARLPAARSVTVRVSISVPGMNPFPPREQSIDLAATNEALSRLRTVGPSQVPTPMVAMASQSAGGLMTMADQALKAAGYPNGIAELRSMLAKYKQK